MLDQIKQWDRELFIYLNSLGVEQYDQFWILVTQEEFWIPLYLFLLGLIFYNFKDAASRKYLLLGYLGSFAVTFGITRLIKFSVQRLRPNQVDSLKELIRVLQEPTYFSFVSGHTSTSMAITTYFVLLFRERFSWIYFLYLWPFLFASSRIYVGVHYPLDLLAGAILGVSIALLIYAFVKKMSPNLANEDL